MDIRLSVVVMMCMHVMVCGAISEPDPDVTTEPITGAPLFTGPGATTEAPPVTGPGATTEAPPIGEPEPEPHPTRVCYPLAISQCLGKFDVIPSFTKQHHFTEHKLHRGFKHC